MKRAWILAMAVALFLLNVVLDFPLFQSGEMPYRGSIEGGYAAMARFLAAHPNPWAWNPTQYCGLPTQFAYLPGVHYLTLLGLRLAPHAEPFHVYRMVTAVFACLAPVSLFLFVLYFTRSRWWAIAAGVGWSLLSPIYGLLRVVEKDRGMVDLPWNVQVLVKYGEGPHVAGVALLPLALIAIWAAATGRKYRQIFVAAVALAAVALTNWIAAFALTICCLLMFVAVAGRGRITGFRYGRVAAAGLLGYLLACFWLTPTFVRTIAFNWPADSFNYRFGSQQRWLLIGLVGCIILIRFAFRRFPKHIFPCFLTLAAFTLGYIVTVYDSYRLDTIPESRRYTLEFEMFLIAGLCEYFRRALASRNQVWRWATIATGAILLFSGAGQVTHRLTQGWSKWGLIPKERTVEYKLARWLNDRHPTGRVFASGGLRYRLNAWFDVPQVGGSFETGLRNRVPLDYAFNIRSGTPGPPEVDIREAIMQMRVLGVEYIAVHGPASEEYYRDFKKPLEFEGVLERVYTEGDNRIYRVPFSSLAHLVRDEEFPHRGERWHIGDYVRAVEDVSRPKLNVTWQGTSSIEIDGPVPEGMAVSLHVNHNRGWVAEQDGRPLGVRFSNLGFIRLDAKPAARTHIVLQYRAPNEPRIAAGISLLAWILALVGLVKKSPWRVPRPVVSVFRPTWVRDSLLLFLGVMALTWPLFRMKYMDNWWSIESTFIADARFLAENWPHPNWQPLWYCGTRFDYIYPPALRYGTAALTKAFGLLPARSYHLYIGFLYCAGMFAVYLLIRIGSGSRRAALLGAAAVALVSPSFLFLRFMRLEARTVHMTPERLSVLVRYGEGPHISALSLLPFALAAAYLGLRARRYLPLALSAFFCAWVVANNFYGATSLAIFFPILVWAIWVTGQDHMVWLRAAAIAALAYGLTAFWLVPSYLRVTIYNLQWVAQPGNRWSIWLALAVALVFVAVSLKTAYKRPERAYGVFITGSLVFFSLNVLGHHFLKFRVAGEPLRLVPELDLVMILFAVEALRQIWNRAARWRRTVLVRAVLVLLVAWGSYPGIKYARHAWMVLPGDPKFEERVEYRITEWMRRNLPDARAQVTGSVRFWYDTWSDLAQVGGGSDQGMLNKQVYQEQWQLNAGDGFELSDLWMKALGTDAAIVNFPNSKEIYHDWSTPQKFKGKAEVVYDRGEGDVIYRVGRKFRDRARVVNTARLLAAPPVTYDTDVEDLRAYVGTIEESNSRAALTRQGPDRMTIHAKLAPGESILVQETYDPAWRAYAGRERLAVRHDIMDFLWIEAPPGDQEIRLVFEMPLENRIGWLLTAISVFLLAWLVRKGTVRRQIPS